MDSRTVWIVGGSRGIGFACAERFTKEGYRVAISGRDEFALKKLVKNLGKDTIPVACDVTQESEVENTYKVLNERFGGAPDVLINSAGISPWSTFSETSISEFDNTISTNTTGMFLTTRTVLNDMYTRGSGTIVQILSVAALKGYRNGAAYVASKFAALGFTNALREEARMRGVSVISVFPGATETEIWDEVERKKNHNRMMQPSDIAEAIFSAVRMPKRALIEEITMRPIGGDL